MPRVVVAGGRDVAQRQHIVRICIGNRLRRVRLLQNRNRLCRQVHPVQNNPPHLHRLQIGRILLDRAGKIAFRLGHVILLVVHDAPQPLHSGRFRPLRSQRIQFPQRIVQFSLGHQVPRALRRRSSRSRNHLGWNARGQCRQGNYTRARHANA